jgi:hypothetical protein
MGFGQMFIRNLLDPLGFSLAVTTLTFLILTWLTLGIRIFFRIRFLKSIAIDDWLMIIAVVGPSTKNNSIYRH